MLTKVCSTSCSNRRARIGYATGVYCIGSFVIVNLEQAKLAPEGCDGYLEFYGCTRVKAKRLTTKKRTSHNLITWSSDNVRWHARYSNLLLLYSHAWSYSSSSYYLTAFPYNERKVDPRLPSHAQAKAETSAQENEKMVRITSSFISLEYCLFHLPTLAYLRTQSRKLKSANNTSQSLVKQVSVCTGHWIELYIYKWIFSWLSMRHVVHTLLRTISSGLYTRCATRNHDMNTSPCPSIPLLYASIDSK